MPANIIDAPVRRERGVVRKTIKPGRWPFAKKPKRDFTPIVNADFQKACDTIVNDVSRMAWTREEHAKDRHSFELRVAVAVIDSVRGLSGMTPGWGLPSVRVMRTRSGFAIQIDAPEAYACEPFETHAEMK